MRSTRQPAVTIRPGVDHYHLLHLFQVELSIRSLPNWRIGTQNNPMKSSDGVARWSRIDFPNIHSI